jgi:hypothetical protein
MSRDLLPRTGSSRASPPVVADCPSILNSRFSVPGLSKSQTSIVEALIGIGADLSRFPWPAEIPMHNTGVRPCGPTPGKTALKRARGSGGVQLPRTPCERPSSIPGAARSGNSASRAQILRF